MFCVAARPAACAMLRGGEGSCLRGKVCFYPHQRGTLVTAEVEGLPSKSGFFGFHIHEGESCKGAGFPETHGHYDPRACPHPYHAGDLPPLLSANGRAFLAVVTGRFTPEEIIGRTVVLHAQPDDLHTQPSGASGEKLACGVICRWG